MKNIIPNLILLLSFNISTGQTFCHTPSESNNLKLNSSLQLGSTNSDTYCLKVYFHVIRRSNGTGGQSIARVYEAFNILNQDFNPHNIFFNWNNQIDYIDNDKYYSTPLIEIFNINNHKDGIDIYLFDDSSSSGGRANGVGQSSEFWVSGSYWKLPKNSLAISHVISHEMGHVLYLWHTHHGTYDEGGNDNPCKELVNGSNSSICGDYVVDTPADPHLQFDVNQTTCEWNSSGTDANGHTYKPDEKNIMSYTDINCMNYFTPKQGLRMRNAISSLPHLEKTVINNCIKIKGPSEVCSGDRPTYTLTDVPAGATIKWEFTYILSGQGTSNVQIGIFYGTDVRTLTAEVTYQGETSTFTKQISSESVSTPSTPEIRKARYNMDFLVCCFSGSQDTYTLDHAECYQNCDDLEWTYTVYFSHPGDQYYFSKSGRSYDKTGTIGVQKHTFHPLIVDAKARNVNRSEQCGDEYSGYSNSFARYYGVVEKGAYSSNTFYNQALNKHVPLAYYVDSRSRTLSVKTLHIWDWLNELYLHKDLNSKEIDVIKNWLSIANENINASVEIRHLTGNVMRTQKLSEGTTDVSLQGLPKGLYVVRFTINNMIHHEVITF